MANSERVSIMDIELTYISVYEREAGERITSYVTGVHGDSVEEITTLAEREYPDEVLVVQNAETYNTALQNDLLYVDGKYKPKPEPTEEELREVALASLDSDYATKIGDVESEMAKAKAIEDEAYFNDLKVERESLVAEYTEKRGAI